MKVAYLTVIDWKWTGNFKPLRLRNTANNHFIEGSAMCIARMVSFFACLVVCSCTVAPGQKGSLPTFLSTGGSRDAKPLLSTLQSGPYQRSNEAIGDEQDISDKRVSHGLVPIPPLASYANRVLEKLKAVSGVTAVPGKVVIVANDQLDAGATPDGNIYISLGYFRSLGNEDQLAALLAHELSHVLLHHHDSSWLSRQQKVLISVFEDGALLKNMFTALASGKSGSVKPYTSGQKEVLSRMTLLVKLNDRALQPAWGRKQEREADRLGVDLLIRAGYSIPDGMLPWLDKVAEWDAYQEKVRAKLAADREAAVDALSSEGRLDEAAKMKIDAALTDVMDGMARSHDSGSDRLEAIDQYLTTVHRDQIGNQIATVKPYVLLLQQGEVNATVSGYRQAFVARNQIVEGRFRDALPVLETLTKRGGVISTHALPNYLLFEARRGLRASSASLETALGVSLGAEEPMWGPVDSAASYYGTRNRKLVVADIGQAALVKFSDAPSAYPRLISLYMANGMKDEAAKVATECRRKHAQMRFVCEKALRE